MAGERLLRLSVEDDIAIASIEGELDLANAHAVGSQIREAIPNSALGLVIDLTAAAYLDSSGIQLLFDLAERLRTRQQGVRVAVPEGAPLRRLFAVVELERSIPLDPTRAAAVAALRTAA